MLDLFAGMPLSQQALSTTWPCHNMLKALLDAATTCPMHCLNLSQNSLGTAWSTSNMPQALLGLSWHTSTQGCGVQANLFSYVLGPVLRPFNFPAAAICMFQPKQSHLVLLGLLCQVLQGKMINTRAMCNTSCKFCYLSLVLVLPH